MDVLSLGLAISGPLYCNGLTPEGFNYLLFLHLGLTLSLACLKLQNVYEVSSTSYYYLSYVEV